MDSSTGAGRTSFSGFGSENWLRIAPQVGHARSERTVRQPSFAASAPLPVRYFMINRQVAAGAVPTASASWFFATLIVVWLAIYLPGLGRIELKGEEGRRAMPGIEMLDSGDWLVPRVGGRAYYRKPPLINWAVGGLVALTHCRDEWVLRLPSAIGILALALAALSWGRSALGQEGAFCAALFVLTNIGAMEKGRRIEIEALYIVFCGLALLWWLRGWSRDGPDAGLWWRWTGAGFFLGLGLLLKGPLHLVFFYLAVISILACAGELRELRRPAHFFGVAVAVLLFAAWAWPMLQRAAGADVTQTWVGQFTERLSGREGDFQFGRYLRNLLFQGWVNFLPWVVLLPLAWRDGAMAGLRPRDCALWRGLRIAIPAGYLAVMLVPGSAARYALPLLVPSSVLIGLVLREGWHRVPPITPIIWRGINLGLLAISTLAILVVPVFVARDEWNFEVGTSLSVLILLVAAGYVMRRRAEPATPADLTLGSGLAMAALSMEFVLALSGRIEGHERLRPLARQIESAVAPGAALYAFDPDSQPAFFYLARPPLYATRAADLPDDARFLFLPEEFLPRLREGGKWEVAEELIRYVDRGGRTLLLVRLSRKN